MNFLTFKNTHTHTQSLGFWGWQNCWQLLDMNMVNNWDVDDEMRFAWKLWAIVSNVSITWVDSKRCEVHTRYIAVQRSRPCGNVHPQNRQTEVQMFGIHRLWDWMGMGFEFFSANLCEIFSMASVEIRQRHLEWINSNNSSKKDPNLNSMEDGSHIMMSQRVSAEALKVGAV